MSGCVWTVERRRSGNCGRMQIARGAGQVAAVDRG